MGWLVVSGQLNRPENRQPATTTTTLIHRIQQLAAGVLGVNFEVHGATVQGKPGVEGFVFLLVEGRGGNFLVVVVEVGLVGRGVRLQVQNAHGVLAIVGPVGQGRRDAAHLHGVDGEEDGRVELVEGQVGAAVAAVLEQAAVAARELIVGVVLGGLGKAHAVGQNASGAAWIVPAKPRWYRPCRFRA